MDNLEKENYISNKDLLFDLPHLVSREKVLKLLKAKDKRMHVYLIFDSSPTNGIQVWVVRALHMTTALRYCVEAGPNATARLLSSEIGTVDYIGEMG